MKIYKDIFFDLDHTLWDHEGNAYITLGNLYQSYKLCELLQGDFDLFFKHFSQANYAVWDLYNQKKINIDFLRVERFRMTFNALGCFSPNEQLIQKVSKEFSTITPYQNKLMPYAMDILHYLHEKGYTLHIITNGFKESQYIKLEHSGIRHFFACIITSQCTGYIKPDLQVYEYALLQAKAKPSETMMIGDDYVSDIFGGKQAGLDTIFYNHHRSVMQNYHQALHTYEITCLSELKNIL